MPPTTVYDPDTIKFPLVKPRIRLSVSEEKYDPADGLLVPSDTYAEQFYLSSVLTTEINDKTSCAEVGIFTYNLILSGQSDRRGFALPGADGGSQNKNGFNGGNLSLYFEQLMPSTAKALTFIATGGRGYSPPNQVGIKGQDGGNGGNGGAVKIIFNTLRTLSGDAAADIAEHVMDPHKEWPTDFKNDAASFVRLLANPEVKATGFPDKAPDWAKSVNSILAAGRLGFVAVVEDLYNALGGNPNHMQGTLTQAVSYHGGDRGFGSKGEGETGKNGEVGKSGQRLARFLQNKTTILQTDVCFAHPMQCQMMLAKVDLLRFSGTITDLATAVTILDRLVYRLQVFAKPQTSPEPPLWAAYRTSGDRLFTVENGPSTEEPYAIRRLRDTGAEAANIKQKILSGTAFAGFDADKVPRGSFKFYQSTTKDLLTFLKDAETNFLQHLAEDADVAKKLATVAARSQALAQAKQSNESMIVEAKSDLSESTRQIEFSVEAITKARDKLIKSIKSLDDFVNKQFGVKFQDFVDAMNSVLFTGGSNPMLALQTAGLFDKGVDNVLRDDGVAVKKSYLIEKLHSLQGGIKELTEKYKVLKHGRLELEDPGANKIVMAEKDWDKLMSDFRNSIPSEKYDDVKKNFKEFHDIVEQRNSTVLHYNAVLIMLLNNMRKRAQLQLDRRDIVRQEYNTLDAGHPAMTSFLKKTYRDSVYSAQVWLYKQQQALRFLALKNTIDLNVIGNTLRGLPYSQLNHGLLEQIHAALDMEHKGYLELIGKDEQSRTKARVYLSHDDTEYMRFVEQGEDVVLTPLTVELDNAIFNAAFDIRLSVVRFFAVGAELIASGDPAEDNKSGDASDHELQVKITHTGSEKFKDSKGNVVKFTHRPLTVLFRYDIKTSEIRSDGNISLDKDDNYARVGPFTSWRVDIVRAGNRHINLKSVQQAYLEFDFHYKALDIGK